MRICIQYFSFFDQPNLSKERKCVLLFVDSHRVIIASACPILSQIGMYRREGMLLVSLSEIMLTSRYEPLFASSQRAPKISFNSITSSRFVARTTAAKGPDGGTGILTTSRQRTITNNKNNKSIKKRSTAGQRGIRYARRKHARPRPGSDTRFPVSMSS